MVFNERQLHFVALGPANDIFDGLQFGHILTRFGGHDQVQVAGAQTSPFVFGDGAPDAALAPVVGGQGQMPITKHAV